MRWASYEGTGSFPGKRWRNALRWQCVAYWRDEAALWPTVLDVTVEASQLGARLHGARLTYFEGLTGSRPRYVSDWLRGGALTQRSALIRVALKYEGRRNDRVVLSGTWYEKGRAGPIEEVIELQGDFVAKGSGDPPVDAAEDIQARCNVQHLAILLETHLGKLADGQELTIRETQNLRTCIAEYKNRSCGTQQCRPVNCDLRQQHEWLAYLRYKDIRDVLDTTKSGIHADPPRLCARAGVETLAVTPMRRRGHYNP